MHLEDLKRWHWALIGMVVGGAFAVAYLAVHAPDDGAAQTMSQAEFENMLLATAATPGDVFAHRGATQMGRPAASHGTLRMVRNLIVYPPDGKGRMMVTGELLDILPQRVDPNDMDRVLPAATLYRKFRFYPPPGAYRPKWHYDGTPGPDLTVRDYLDKVRETRPTPGLAYRYAWWTITPLAVAIGAAAGLVLIGGVWPTVVGLLTGAGFGRPPATEPAYDLDPFSHAPDPAKPAPAAPDPAAAAALAARIDELEGGLLADLRQADAARREEPAEPEPRAKELKAAPLEAPATAAEAPKADVEFTGEYYPVAHNVTKKPD